MIGSANATPTIGVKDMDRAQDFYCNTLGLEVEKESPYMLLLKSGNGMVQVYATNFAGTNQATYVTWDVADIRAEVEDLKAKGVAFEHYEGMPETKLEGDIHITDNEHAAWFKDPDGNILCLHQTV